MLFSESNPLKAGGIEADRRQFLVGAAASAGGLLIGFGMPSTIATAAKKAATPNPFSAYVQIGADNKVTVFSSQMDKGQGAYHGLATLVIEELGADWSQIHVVGASGNTALYGNPVWGGVAQGTGGSTSIAGSFDRYRMAGATAREMLVQAAAKSWGVPAKDIKVENGKISHASGKSAAFGELAADAAKLPVPQKIALKKPEEWTEIGDPKRRRFDTAPKTNGTHTFTIDVKLPGMLTAVVAHGPTFGAQVKSFDAADAKKVRGVRDVVQIASGVAVVADHMWAAIKGREALKVEWDESGSEKRSSTDIMNAYKKAAAEAPKAVARSDGDAAKAMASAAKVVEATYEFPYLAHAAMEPLNAVVHKNESGMVEIWGGHQIPDVYQFIASKITGLKPDKIKMNVMTTGGSFGRRAVADGDVVAEAVMIAKAIGYKAPVKVQWTREDDMTGGRYRPAYVHKLRAGLDDQGNIVAWENHVVGQSIVAGTPFEQALVKKGIDKTSIEGSDNVPYAIPNVSVGLTTTDVKVPVLWWRAVGSTHTAYAVESFMDEVAAAAGRDPYEFRMAMLGKHPRHAGVLKLAAEKAGWGKPLPKGRFHGIAVHESFSSYVAHVAEISIEDGEAKVHKVTVAVDCGVVVNPDVVHAQIEGGTGFGIGSILGEEITLDQGRVEQVNYDGYTPLRIDAMPDIDVHIVSSTERPTGVGEPGVPSIGPAIANAYAAATGKRVRALPFSKSVGGA
ncbi:MAG: xanthine dehydrogenase family protein molybdopterin-binding subunit [Pseudomonadota bacterium]